MQCMLEMSAQTGGSGAPKSDEPRRVLTLQVGDDGRLRLLPRPPPAAPPAEAEPEPEQVEAVVASEAGQSAPELEAKPLPAPRRRIFRPLREPDGDVLPVQEAAPGPIAIPKLGVAPPAKGAGSLIDFRNVSLRYGKRVVLSEVNLLVEPGELVALLGPSGAGKTSMLRLLQGLSRPSAGSLWIDRVAVHRTWPFQIRRLRRRIGVVFQDYCLLPNRSALENVMFALRSDLTITRAEARQRAREQLSLVGLAGRERSLPGQLSGGQQQRVAVARALVLRPRILLADEPTASLDRAQARNVMRLLESIAEGGTAVVLATHDQSLVSKSRARIVHISHGRIVGESRGRRRLRVVR